MEISAALAADLRALTEALGTPDVDLEMLLQTFADDTRQVVDSYLGLVITIILDDYPITLSMLDPAVAATSLRIPLNTLGPAQPGSVLVLYAKVPGACVDLAADISFALGVNPDAFMLDDDLNPMNASMNAASGIGGLAEHSQINRAIGVLIDRGFLPDDAQTELHRLAGHAQITRHAAAQQLIDSLGPNQPL